MEKGLVEMIRALVVDDSEAMTRSICRMLGFLNVQAVPAFSVREALLYLRERTPDVIFLDLRMPGFDGFEVLGYLRREPRLENLPVCIISAERQEETIQKAKAQGVFAYLVKPVRIEDLEAALDQLHRIEI